MTQVINLLVFTWKRDKNGYRIFENSIHDKDISVGRKIMGTKSTGTSIYLIIHQFILLISHSYTLTYYKSNGSYLSILESNGPDFSLTRGWKRGGYFPSVCPLILFWDNFRSRIRVPGWLYGYWSRIHIFYSGYEIGFTRERYVTDTELPVNNTGITR